MIPELFESLKTSIGLFTFSAIACVSLALLVKGRSAITSRATGGAGNASERLVVFP